jgi:electron-transferring-flavoprotein dehydrogenase
MSHRPADYLPKVDPKEFVTTPTESPDAKIDVGVLFVGAGMAGLAGAIRLAQLLEGAPEIKDKLGEVPIAVAEKGKYPGAHLLSGAVINPSGFKKLFPETPESEFPFRKQVTKEAVYFLTPKKAFKAPVIPPTMHNHGNYVASISEMGKWLAQKAEALGIMILNETPASKLVMQDGVVKGVQTGDKGLGRDGQPLSNFEPGVQIASKVTVLSEGTAGHLTGALIQLKNLQGPNPQVYALGVKEIWDVPKPLDRVIHTMGWPLRGGKKYGEFGGSFIYPLGDNQVSIGLVVGLDSADATVSVHDLLQELKLHPLIKPILEGGKRADGGWGAKTIPEGGFYSLPSKLNVPGALLTGDSAGFVNVPALKGVHYAMSSGIFAAEAIFESLKAGRDLQAPGSLDLYDEKVKQSFIWKDLYKVRNMRQAFQYGFIPGSMLAGLMTVTGGLFPGWRFSVHSDSERALFIGQRSYVKPDNKLTFDKLSSVYVSGNRSRDTQPSHLKLQHEVPEAVGEAWINMCPAAVYEWHVNENGKKVIQTNPSNCVQCGAITAKGGRLTPPEGGSGPEYNIT